MEIDPNLPIPIYFQLKTLLMEEILRGGYGPGRQLPTEHQLCERYGISRTPVTRALSELAQEGVLIRRRRRGTFVNPHWVHPPSEGPELRVIVPGGPWEELIREAAPAGLRLNVATVPLIDLHQALSHAVAEGRAPDLAVMDSVWLPEFSSLGFLWPLEQLDPAWVRAEFRRDFLGPFVARDGGPVDTFGVPAEADVAGLWYRRRDLEELGIEPARTWKELLAVGRALRRAGVDAPVVAPAGSAGGETTTYCLLAFLASTGGAVIGREGVILQRPANVEALRFLRSLVREGLMPEEAVAYTWDRPIRLLGQGRAAIGFGGSYEGPRLARSARIRPERLPDHFTFTPVPRAPNGRPATLAGGMAYAIFRQAVHPDLAMRLLRDVVSTEALVRMSRATGQIPPRRTAVAIVERDAPFVASTAAMLERAVVRPGIPSYPRVSIQLRSMLEAVLTGRLTAPAAVSRTAQMISAITGLPLAAQ